MWDCEIAKQAVGGGDGRRRGWREMVEYFSAGRVLKRGLTDREGGGWGSGRARGEGWRVTAERDVDVGRREVWRWRYGGFRVSVESK